MSKKKKKPVLFLLYIEMFEREVLVFPLLDMIGRIQSFRLRVCMYVFMALKYILLINLPS